MSAKCIEPAFKHMALTTDRDRTRGRLPFDLTLSMMTDEVSYSKTDELGVSELIYTGL